VTRMRAALALLLVGAAILAACSSGRRIDGTSAATFERSVAMLQNDLPARRRDEFDIALAVVWMRAARLDAGDVDGDGDTDYFDARAMADNVGELLAAIQRGDLVSAAEKSKGEAVAGAYFKQLDGLGYDDVVELANAADDERYVAQLKRQAACPPQQGWRDARPPPGGYTSRIRTCD
jgi:hypothetical protein